MKENASLSKKNWFILIIFGLAGYAAFTVQDQWINVYIFDKITPDPSIVAMKTALQALAATISTFLIGTISDRIGKRKPFMLLGLLIWGLMAIAFPFIGSYAVDNASTGIIIIISLAMFMSFCTSAAYDSSYQAWLTDNTNKSNRGMVFGIVGMVPLLVVLIASGAGAIIDNFGYKAFFMGSGVIIGGLAVLSTVFISDKNAEKKTEKTHLIKDLAGVFTPKSFKENKIIFLVFTFSTVMLVAQYTIQAYDLIYMNSFLGITKTAAGLLGLIVVPVTIVASLIYGRLNDKGKSYNILMVAPMLLAVGMFGFSISKSMWQLGLFKVFSTLGTVGLMLTAMVISKNLVSKDQRGQFEGVRVFFQMLIPMLIGPALGSTLIRVFGQPTIMNGVEGFVPTPIIYQVAGVISLLSYIFLFILLRAKKKDDQKNNAKKAA